MIIRLFLLFSVQEFLRFYIGIVKYAFLLYPIMVKMLHKFFFIVT